MEYSIDYFYHQININQLLKYYNKEEVFKLCSECNNYNKNWSCPPHNVGIHSFLSNFDYMHIIVAKINLYNENINSNDSILKSFIIERKNFNNNLYNIFRDNINCEILISGACDKCNLCNRVKNIKCFNRTECKFSLESLGFRVDEIVKEIFKLEIMWINNKSAPKYLLNIGAVLSTKLNPINLEDYLH